MFLLTYLLYLSYSIHVSSAVRVCPSFGEYNNWFFSNGCYDNPVGKQNITEVIRSWGFTAEEHYLTTDDGYILLLERAYATITKKIPIIIVHGIIMNGFAFVHQGNASLVYLLGNLGYDVWILNYRGTEYSKRHKTLTARNSKYWSFSINEMGIYDIRTAIKHVTEETEENPIYIGYSMGTTGFFIYATTFPDEAKSSVKGMIGLAPVINYRGIKSIIQFTGRRMVWPILKFFIYLLWQGEMLPGFSILLKPLMSVSLGMYIFQLGLNLVFGPDYEQMNPLTYPLYLNWIDTIGAEVYTHYVQIYQSGVFQNYDHGRAKNLVVYRQPTPPAYNLSKVSLPVALFVGPNDWLATTTNAEQLYSELPMSSRCGYNYVPFPKWSHVDFLSAKDVEKYLYQYVFYKIDDIDNENCRP